MLGFGAVLGAKVWCPMWVLGGAKLTSKGLVSCVVSCVDAVQG